MTTLTMKAAVLSAPGPVERLEILDLPIPEPKDGWVRISGPNAEQLH
jgi:hypothetical protein